MSTVLQTKVLRPKTSEDELAVYRAALEWDLLEPIVIESQEDIKSKVQWLERLTPFAHQVMNLITFCRRLPVTLLADDVGLGKTISAGLILSELISRDRVANALVVCPKLLGPQWKSELEQKFGIPAMVVTGKELLDEPPGGEHVVITTYQSARLYLEQVPPDRFQMLILDEAHKLRNLYGVEKPPMVATLFRKLLEARRFRFVLMLTATPIHNRLWDIYSLVDLLTVARGHKNPFGATGLFARKYIADSRETARQLRPEAQSEFRSIVYGYMSRTRRSDANLHFPERVIRNHTPLPSPGELALIDVVGKHIVDLNRLAQISILQALASSPDALKAQIQTMGRNGTVSAEFVADVKHVIGSIGASAKLQSLGMLVEGLTREDPRLWRVVVFTCRRETQTTIQAFCEQRGLSVGIINGDSGANNQLTIEAFKTDPPKLHVIVSTEAGSEGVNLQVANVLVNFDLPWNPMIVEQRIGRVQRLASRHANVLIYNITLRGTFEEYIVGRLLEKLQMASQAIGDIESLLEAAGASDEDDDGTSFEERIRLLVVAALTGKDFEAEARLTEASIARAQETLATEKQNIDAMLSPGAASDYVGPRAPKLCSSVPGMDLRSFTLTALSVLGAPPVAVGHDLYRLDTSTGELITFDPGLADPRPRTLYSASSSAFQRLVDSVVATGIHDVHDHDVNPSQEAAHLAAQWVSEFAGVSKSLKAAKVWRSFQGSALLRVRVTVAHDSYERLLSVECDPEIHHASLGMAALEPVARLIDDPVLIGVNVGSLRQTSEQDPSVSEFCRFYMERREQELLAVGDDARRRKKIEEDFTPRLTVSIVSLTGIVRRNIGVRVAYQVGDGTTYTDDLVLAPSEARVLESPTIETCAVSGRRFPATCLEVCSVSHKSALKSSLVTSAASGRRVLPEFAAKCESTGESFLLSELERSAASGKLVDRRILESSSISGKLVEAELLSACSFTKARALPEELAISDLSGRLYRKDQQVRSQISGRTGHTSEATQCVVSGVWLLIDEGEVCAVTNSRVSPGMLDVCEASGQRVLPTQLARSSVSGKLALSRLLTESSISRLPLLQVEAVRALSGNPCTPAEAIECGWSARGTHPEDIRVCSITGLKLHRNFVGSDSPFELRILRELLDGVDRGTDANPSWPAASAALVRTGLKGKLRIAAARFSPSKDRIVGVVEIKDLFGLRTTWAGFVYQPSTDSVFGMIRTGKRTTKGWLASE